MAKIQIKSDKLTPFGGIFSIMEQFDSTLSSVIDSTLGQRCKSFGYQYSEIIRSLMSIYFCGCSVTTHLMNHLSLHTTLHTCSSDTILIAIKELTQETSHTHQIRVRTTISIRLTLSILYYSIVCFIWPTETISRLK